MSETTTIQIRRSTWRELNRLRDTPEDTFDDVICQLLEESDSFYEPRTVPPPNRPVLKDTDDFVHVDIDSELVTIPRSEITWHTKQRDDLEVEAMTIFDAAGVDFPEEKLLVAADGNLEWTENGIVDLREHRRFDVRDKPNFGGG